MHIHAQRERETTYIYIRDYIDTRKYVCIYIHTHARTWGCKQTVRQSDMHTCKLFHIVTCEITCSTNFPRIHTKSDARFTAVVGWPSTQTPRPWALNSVPHGSTGFICGQHWSDGGLSDSVALRYGRPNFCTLGLDTPSITNLNLTFGCGWMLAFSPLAWPGSMPTREVGFGGIGLKVNKRYLSC